MAPVNFYAAKRDQLSVLEFVLSQDDLEVWEAQSYGSPPQRLISPVGLRGDRTVYRMRPRESGGSLIISERPPGHFETEGWGLIQLLLRAEGSGRIPPSSVSVNTER